MDELRDNEEKITAIKAKEVYDTFKYKKYRGFVSYTIELKEQYRQMYNIPDKFRKFLLLNFFNEYIVVNAVDEDTDTVKFLADYKVFNKQNMKFNVMLDFITNIFKDRKDV